MKLLMLATDISAIHFVTKMDAHAKRTSYAKNVVSYASKFGGDELVGVYTLSNEHMPFKGKSQYHLNVSIYKDSPKTFSIQLVKSWLGMSVKRQNRLDRTKNRPQQLSKCTVFMAINRDALSNLEPKNILMQLSQLTDYQVPNHLQSYGGAIVYNKLASTGHVVTSSGDLPRTTSANSIYKELLGFTKPAVSYGTTDLANVFELLQALKLGYHLGLPVVFDSHMTAHNWRYWRTGFLNPSLTLLGANVASDQFGLTDGSKYTDTIDIQAFRNALPSLGLSNIAQYLPVQTCSVNTLYKKVVKTLADQILSLLGIQVAYGLVDFAGVCAKTEFWHMTAQELSRIVYTKAGHDVVLLNSPQGMQYKTNSTLPNYTIAQLYKQGWWLGGFPVYMVGYSLGRYGGLVTMVKDSSAGNVNLAAKEYLSSTSSSYVTPVGLFRLTALGQNEDWSIDPLVMLELIKRWGSSKSKVELNKVWNAIEVPLQKEHIGRKTIATVNLKGVSIKVIN